MLRSSIRLRPVAVRGYGGVAVTPHYLSTQAALSAMAKGGNAIDAAIAANAVQGVVAPETCGIGGDLFALVGGPQHQQPLVLNSSGRAGSGAGRLAAELRAAGAEAIPQRHPAAVTVPGCVDGWMELHGRLGNIDLGSILEPAVRLAHNGFPANREQAAAFAARRDELEREPGAADMYPGGRPPLEGERITRVRLGETLEDVADRGRDAFYSGPVAASIRRAVDGAITTPDLERAQAEWVEPLSMDLFGATAWTIPPNSQGYISLLALAIMERIGVQPPDEPLAWHLAIESYRLAASDHGELLSDPDTMSLAPADLVSPSRIEALADRYSDDGRAAMPPPVTGSGGTAYMCVVDDSGMGVSLIQSNFNGIGSGLAIPEGGFLLHDRGRGFTLRPGHPNELAPGRRPLHTLSPTMWTTAGRLSGILGTRGGFMQPQLVVQLATLIIAHHASPERAMAAPRWMVPLPAQEGAGGPVEVEPGTPASVVDGLRRRGHDVEMHEIPQSGWGPMSTIQVSEIDLRTGAADPRVDTASAAAR